MNSCRLLLPVALVLAILGAGLVRACPGDGDGDGVCDALDDCPTVPNADQSDIDGDLVGDACDEADATLVLRTVQLKADTSATSDNGNVKIKGTLDDGQPGDRLFFAGGLVLRVSDGGGFDETYAFAQGECGMVASGRWVCLGLDRRGKAAFRATRAAPHLHRFSITVKKLPIAAPFASPVRVVVSQDAYVDRVGTLATCTATTTRLSCKAP